MSSILASTVNVNYSYLINNQPCNAALAPKDVYISIGSPCTASLSPTVVNTVKWNDIVSYTLSINNKCALMEDIIQLKINMDNNLEFVAGTLINVDRNYVYKDKDINSSFIDLETVKPNSSLNLKFKIKVNPTLENSYVKTPLSLLCEFKYKSIPNTYYSNTSVLNITQSDLIFTEIKKFENITFENVGTVSTSGINYKYPIPLGVVPSAVTGTLNSTPVTIPHMVFGQNLMLKIPALPSSSADNTKILDISIED